MDPFDFGLNTLNCSISCTERLLEARIPNSEKSKLNIMQCDGIFPYISFVANVGEILLHCIIFNFDFFKLGILASDNPSVQEIL